MTLQEALLWTLVTAGPHLHPFEHRFDTRMQLGTWCCRGCFVVVQSLENPPLETFPHVSDCKYVEVLRLAGVLNSPEEVPPLTDVPIPETHEPPEGES